MMKPFLFIIFLIAHLPTQASYHNQIEPINRLMFEAVANNEVSLLAKAINKGCDLNALDHQQRTPLLLAIQKHHLQVFKYLLTHGANVNAHNQQISLMELAAVDKQSNYLKLLLAHGGNPNQQGVSSAQAILITATQAGRVENVQLLLAASAKPDQLDARGDSALHKAITKQYFEIAYLLINHGASLTAINSNGASAQALLDKVVLPKQTEQVEWFNKIQAEINSER